VMMLLGWRYVDDFVILFYTFLNEGFSNLVCLVPRTCVTGLFWK
jgi:hypothetical protein